MSTIRGTESVRMWAVLPEDLNAKRSKASELPSETRCISLCLVNEADQERETRVSRSPVER